MGLGAELRKSRERNGLGLREVALKAKVTHGYVSQLEREEIAQPAPAVLQKLAEGYGEPFELLMRWAGYIEAGNISENQARALKFMGDELSDDELKVIRSVLDAIRARNRAGFAGFESLDGHLSPADITEIRRHAEALLREADAHGIAPTPLEELLRVSKLVAANEIYLDVEERNSLRAKFGSLVDHVLTRLQGVVHFRSREVWINPDANTLRRRFVTSHEVGHNLLPWHRDIFAYLDDNERLRPDIAVRYEREANQVAIELLAQGDRLRAEADDSELTFQLISELAARYEISLQATARRVVEESKRECALVMAFKGPITGRLMPPHVYCSQAFEARFGWRSEFNRDPKITQTLEQPTTTIEIPFATADLGGNPTFLRREVWDTLRAKLVLFVAPRRRVLRLNFSRAEAEWRTA